MSDPVVDMTISEFSDYVTSVTRVGVSQLDREEVGNLMDAAGLPVETYRVVVDPEVEPGHVAVHPPRREDLTP